MYTTNKIMLKLLFCVLIYVTATNCDGVENAFQEAEIVPDVISKAPSKLITIEFENGLKVNKGNALTPTQVQNQPIKIDYEFEENSFYTLIMTDPDAPSRADPQHREWQHWLVVNIPTNDVNHGTTLSEYVGSGPPQGTGLHRYVFLLYKQAGLLKFDEPHRTNTSPDGRGLFSTAKFAEKHNLGDPVAGNFYQAEYDSYVPTVYKKLGQ